ncbi:HWE histidine kinase domain-containing protein [Methylobacterium sp. 17Sr1-1]|uniref:HWE histidine kinase domain-containing protein n=1 Tax=Methylobacterium sp. 17Sr1-1 TaxID=2202826 RepID=UPI000D6F2F89|nr:HWE histidine kinase domain-containing protein [Methylobacterium sp. 17Sr1-1]AWN51071.1 histidine kinase [Methylobacterium sp. 17Sr1-1]
MPDPHSARLGELEADNARLRRLLKLKHVSSTLRHQLRNTLIMFRSIIRQSAETSDDLETYVGRLEDRLDAILRVQNTTDLRDEVNLHNLIADELLRHRALEGEAAFLEGPDVLLQPKPAQVLALAIHELVANAIEHGALAPYVGGRISIAWQVEEGPVLVITSKETGLKGMANPARRGFGMAVLNETLGYELKAETTVAFEPDGLRCVIRLPLPFRVGRVIASVPSMDQLEPGSE